MMLWIALVPVALVRGASPWQRGPQRSAWQQTGRSSPLMEAMSAQPKVALGKSEEITFRTRGGYAPLNISEVGQLEQSLREALAIVTPSLTKAQGWKSEVEIQSHRLDYWENPYLSDAGNWNKLFFTASFSPIRNSTSLYLAPDNLKQLKDRIVGGDTEDEIAVSYSVLSSLVEDVPRFFSRLKQCVGKSLARRHRFRRTSRDFPASRSIREAGEIQLKSSFLCFQTKTTFLPDAHKVVSTVAYHNYILPVVIGRAVHSRQAPRLVQQISYSEVKEAPTISDWEIMSSNATGFLESDSLLDDKKIAEIVDRSPSMTCQQSAVLSRTNNSDHCVRLPRAWDPYSGLLTPEDQFSIVCAGLFPTGTAVYVKNYVHKIVKVPSPKKRKRGSPLEPPTRKSIIAERWVAHYCTENGWVEEANIDFEIGQRLFDICETDRRNQQRLYE